MKTINFTSADVTLWLSTKWVNPMYGVMFSIGQNNKDDKEILKALVTGCVAKIEF